MVPKTGVLAGVYVQAISAYAPHPNAAKLWTDYILSKRGQTIIADQALLGSVRTDVEGDRRAWRVRLTPKGRAAFADMALAHEAWIVQAFSALDAREVASLYRLLGKVKTGFHADA